MTRAEIRAHLSTYRAMLRQALDDARHSDAARLAETIARLSRHLHRKDA